MNLKGLSIKTSLAVTAIALATGIPVTSATAADFYAGKTIDFVIGANPGGGYDRYARVLARHISQFIPGNPTFVAKNMPGAGSSKAAAYIAKVASKRGTEIGAVFPGSIVGPLYSANLRKKYDPTKFQFLGSADSGTRVCVTWHTSKTKTFEDAQKRKTILGASASGGSTKDYAEFLNAVAGTKFEIVAGYKGTVDITLAVEQGEIDGLCGYDWSSLSAQKPGWIRDKKLNVIIQMGLEPHPELAKMGVPEVWKYLKTEEDKNLIELLVGEQMFGRPYIAPPGMPTARVALLRNAFDKTVKDKKYLADAKKSRLTVNPSSGKTVEMLVNKLYATPASLVKRSMAIREGGKKKK